jgi:molybdopterin/thiamine biosynthesis adenylyltransferase
VIVDGTDNFPARYLVNDACVMYGKPNAWGSIFRFEGQASVFRGARRAVLSLPAPGAAAARTRAELRGSPASWACCPASSAPSRRPRR